MSEMIPDEKDDLLAVGLLGSPFGVRGFLRFRSYSGEIDHIAALRDVLLARGAERVPARIEESTEGAGGICLRVSGVSTPEDARKWTGWEILVTRDRAVPLRAGEYYVADLVGCALTLGGKTVGTILSVTEGGAASLLEVRLAADRTVLVPFRKEFIGTVDTERRELELLVDWILE